MGRSLFVYRFVTGQELTVPAVQVMLEDSCETANCNLPLMRTKDRSRTICVLCNDGDLPPAEQAEPAPIVDDTDENASEPEVLGTDAEGKSGRLMLLSLYDADCHSADSAVGDVESVEVERRREQAQLATRLLGQRMLAGWALLGEICRNSTCYGVSAVDFYSQSLPLPHSVKTYMPAQIPLVRNRQKRKQCVICQTWYDDETENTEGDGAAQAAAGPSSVIVKEKHVQDDTKTLNLESTPKANAEFVSNASDSTKKRKFDTPSTTPVFVPGRIDRQSIASHAAISVASEVDLTIGALLQRLTTLRQSLEEPSLHPGDIKAVSDAIGSVAAAITACQAVKKL